MTALVGAELLKLRTTRAWIGYVLVLVLLTGIGVAGQIGSASDLELAEDDYVHNLVETASFSGLIALLLGITSVTWEWRHGTITPTFLATPRRERVVAAKLAAAALAGGALAVLAVLVALAVAVPWLAAEGAPLGLDGSTGALVGRVVLAAVLWGALGAAVGSLVHSQVGALVGAIVWLVLAEALVVGLLGLVDADAVGDYLPGGALGALDGTADDGLPAWAGALVGLGYLGAFGVLGVLRTRRRDVT